jgi:hypothetical protein
MDSYNEEQSFICTVNCFDENNNIKTPDELIYSLYDLTNNQFLIEDTTITPTSSSATISIPIQNQLIQNRENESEERILTVKWHYNSGASGSSLTYKYLLQRLMNL